jgi:hypothetical protein
MITRSRFFQGGGRIVIAKPRVNYQSMMPVDAAIAKARSVSSQLMHEMPGSNIRRDLYTARRMRQK